MNDVDRLRRERDEYQSQAHELSERIGRMTTAASSAAATAVTALEEIQRLETLAAAAVAWRQSGEEGPVENHMRCARELRALVDEYLARKATRS